MPVDLEALAREARALTGNADLVDAVLPRRRLDRGDLRGQRARIVWEGSEQIGLERDEEVLGAQERAASRGAARGPSAGPATSGSPPRNDLSAARREVIRFSCRHPSLHG